MAYFKRNGLVFSGKQEDVEAPPFNQKVKSKAIVFEELEGMSASTTIPEPFIKRLYAFIESEVTLRLSELRKVQDPSKASFTILPSIPFEADHAGMITTKIECAKEDAEGVAQEAVYIEKDLSPICKETVDDVELCKPREEGKTSLTVIPFEAGNDDKEKVGIERSKEDALEIVGTTQESINIERNGLPVAENNETVETGDFTFLAELEKLDEELDKIRELNQISKTANSETDLQTVNDGNYGYDITTPQLKNDEIVNSADKHELPYTLPSEAPLQSRNEALNPDKSVNQETDKRFTWMYSEFTKRICVDCTWHDLKGYIEKYGKPAKQILSQYKGVVKHLLRLSNGKAVDKLVLITIYERLEELILSKNFGALSDTLSIHVEIQNTYRKMLKMLKATKGESRISLHYTLEQRTDLFAILYEMNGLVTDDCSMDLLYRNDRVRRYYSSKRRAK